MTTKALTTTEKKKGGRPTKYRPWMIKKAKEYIESCSREQTELPTIDGLALVLGVDDQRISDYSKKYPKFCATIKNLKHKQKNQLINDGMYGGKQVNAAMAIFLLKANHGLKDGSQVNVNIDARRQYVVNAPARDHLESSSKTSRSPKKKRV
jgi:hypothetical protein